MPDAAVAQCTGGLGTTTCTGDPASFPSGGAAPVLSDTTLNVNSLTNNINPNNGTAGAAIVIAPGAASNGSIAFRFREATAAADRTGPT